MKIRHKLKSLAVRALKRFPGAQYRARRASAMWRSHFSLRRNQELLAGSLARDGRLLQSADLLESKRKVLDMQMRVGRLKLDAGDITAAMESFRWALNAVAYHPDQVIPVGHALAVAGYLDESVEIYTEAARSYRKNAPDRLALADREVQVLPYYWVDRIGHLTFLDAFIKMMILGWLPVRTVILLAPADKVANFTYLDCWRPYLLVETDPQTIAGLAPLVNIIEDQYFAAYFAPSGVSCWWIRAAWAAELQWDREGRKPLLELSEPDERDAARAFALLGMPPDAWFVCLHVRESGYHADKCDPTQIWRDSDIERYDAAIDAIVARGGWVVRMGDPGMKALRPRPGVIDYALGLYKSDWLDIMLCARCRFFIATNSGLGIVPGTFGVPAIAVDYMPLANELYVKQGSFIPKLCWLSIENRHLSFDECMEAPIGYTHRGESFAGIQLRQNTQEEIAELVLEMLDRLDGVLADDPDYEILQRRFNALRDRHGVVSDATVGRAFLKRHAHLLLPSGEVRSLRPARDELVASFSVPENNFEHNLERGKAFFELGAFGMALACFEEASRLQPENAEIPALLRDAYFERERAKLSRHPRSESQMDAGRMFLSAASTDELSADKDFEPIAELSETAEPEQIEESAPSLLEAVACEETEVQDVPVAQTAADLDAWRAEMPPVLARY